MFPKKGKKKRGGGGKKGKKKKPVGQQIRTLHGHESVFLFRNCIRLRRRGKKGRSVKKFAISTS